MGQGGLHELPRKESLVLVARSVESNNGAGLKQLALLAC
jgi:hypothetical protein